MPRIAREQILQRLRAKVAQGRPIVGGGAGTGLSAKCEEAGGIDLIVIYNSGRYRMAGRGSLAGLLAYGNANEIVVEMGATAMTITHDMSSVRAIADQVAMLHAGRIQWTGPVAEMDATPDPYVQQFIHGRAQGPIESVR